jgi:HD-like signal output (HDOD) protein
MTAALPKTDLDLKKMMAGSQLAALPQSAILLLELSRNPSNGPGEFAAPIEADPGLTGQVLKFVNSSYFGFARKIASVKLGISLVGVRTIKNFALWNAVFSLVPNPKCGPFDLKNLWQDSLRRGLFARDMANLMGLKTSEDIFTAALLQDMAIPLLAKEIPQVYGKLLEARSDGNCRLSALERDTLGWNHADAAAILARQWNLPDHFVALMAGHTDRPTIAAATPEILGRQIVSLSSLLPATVDSHWKECPALEESFAKVVPSGQVSLPGLLEQVDREFADFAPVLKIAVPRKSLAECLQETAVAS